MRAPIAGVHYHPPARAIISALGADTPLALVPEPENPHDCNAIAVKVAPEYLPANDEAFELQLPSYGSDIATLRAGGPIMLGYVPRAENVVWGDALRAMPQATARLTFDPAGRACVELS